MSDYKEIIHRADELFMHQQYVESANKYREALEAADTDDQKTYCQTQLTACTAPDKIDNNDPGSSKKKRKRLFKFNLAQELIELVIKKLLPKIKPMIIKNKPKAVDFMLGKMDMKGQPIEPVDGKWDRRTIVIDVKIDPEGNIDKNDILVAIMKSEYTKIQFAKDPKTGESIAHEKIYSLSSFMDEFLSINLKDVAKELKKEAEEKQWLE